MNLNELQESRPTDAAPAARRLDRARMVEICQRMMTLRLAGQLDGVIDFFAPDCHYKLVGNAQFVSFSADCYGREQTFEKIKSLHVLYEYCDLKPINFIADPDQFVVHWQGVFRNRGTGPALDLEGVAHVKFRDGLIVEYTNFLDTAAVAQVIDARNPAAPD